jgi:hypothetical protein
MAGVLKAAFHPFIPFRWKREGVGSDFVLRIDGPEACCSTYTIFGFDERLELL